MSGEQGGAVWRFVVPGWTALDTVVRDLAGADASFAVASAPGAGTAWRILVTITAGKVRGDVDLRLIPGSNSLEDLVRALPGWGTEPGRLVRTAPAAAAGRDVGSAVRALQPDLQGREAFLTVAVPGKSSTAVLLRAGATLLPPDAGRSSEPQPSQPPPGDPNQSERQRSEGRGAWPYDNDRSPAIPVLHRLARSRWRAVGFATAAVVLVAAGSAGTLALTGKHDGAGQALAVGGGFDAVVTPVTPSAAVQVSGHGVIVSVPAGTVSASTDLAIAPISDAAPLGEGGMLGAGHSVNFTDGEQPKKALQMTIPLDAAQRQLASTATPGGKVDPARTTGKALFVASRNADGGPVDLHLAELTADGTGLVFTTDHLTNFWPITIDLDALRKDAQGAWDNTLDALGFRAKPPECGNTPAGWSLGNPQSASDPPLYACLEAGANGGWKLRVVNHRSVAFEFYIPNGATLDKTVGPSLSEAVWNGIYSAGLPGAPPGQRLLPGSGEIELSGTKAATVEFLLNNVALVFDTLLSVIGKVYKGGTEIVVAVASCLWEGLGLLQHLDTKSITGTATTCVEEFVEGAWKVVLAVLTVVPRTVVGLVDSVRGLAPVEMRIGDVATPPSTAPVQVHRGIPHTGDDFPTCNEWRNMREGEADHWLSELQRYHGQDPSDIGLARLSLGAFCGLYPGRSIDGAYHG